MHGFLQGHGESPVILLGSCRRRERGDWFWCGKELREDFACATGTLADGRAFKVIQRGTSEDSAVVYGLVGSSEKGVVWFEYDSAPCGRPHCKERFESARCHVNDVFVVHDPDSSHRFKCPKRQRSPTTPGKVGCVTMNEMPAVVLIAGLLIDQTAVATLGRFGTVGRQLTNAEVTQITTLVTDDAAEPPWLIIGFPAMVIGISTLTVYVRPNAAAGRVQFQGFLRRSQNAAVWTPRNRAGPRPSPGRNLSGPELRTLTLSIVLSRNIITNRLLFRYLSSEIRFLVFLNGTISR
jgi:hypothetical protein